MKHLVPSALILFLCTIAGTRIWARRCLGLLDLEQKGRVMEASAPGHVWPFTSLAVAVAVTAWWPTGWIPGYYGPGIFAACIAVPFFVSLGAAMSNLIRLSRVGLPRPYLQSVRLQAIAFHLTLLFLIGAVIYDAYAYMHKRG